MIHGLYVGTALAAFCAVMYLLYRQGWVVTKQIRAVLFVFRPGRDGDKVEVNACTGWVQHRGRFRESREYAFVLDARMPNGAVEAALLDKDGSELLKLDQQTPTGRISLDKSRRCTLRWSFQQATGSCTLRWCAGE